MAKISKTFGARYGTKIRNRYDEIMSKVRGKKKCPYCNKVGQIKRLAKGIWHCEKCNTKFAGKTYTMS